MYFQKSELGKLNVFFFANTFSLSFIPNFSEIWDDDWNAICAYLVEHDLIVGSVNRQTLWSGTVHTWLKVG